MSRLIWITGAGKGIGRALALELGRRGDKVAVSARTEADLADLADLAQEHAAICPYQLDVTEAEAVEETLDRIERDHGPIDVAIFNAGTHQPVTPETLALAPFRRLMEVNYFGVVNGLVPMVHRMKARRAGRIVVVSSVAGYVGLPTASAYGASKAALINLCEALKVELEPYGVELQLVCPGFVETPLTDKNDFPMPFIVPVERAAQHMADGLMKKRFEIAFPFIFALLMKGLRLLPYGALWPLTRKMIRK